MYHAGGARSPKIRGSGMNANHLASRERERPEQLSSRSLTLPARRVAGAPSRPRQFQPEARAGAAVGGAVGQAAAEHLGPLLRQRQAQPRAAGRGVGAFPAAERLEDRSGVRPPARPARGPPPRDITPLAAAGFRPQPDAGLAASRVYFRALSIRFPTIC